MESRYLLRSGVAGSGSYEVEVTPDSAGWGYSSLKIISLEPENSHRFQTASDEVIVLPLSGSVEVEVDDARCELDGRPSVFEGPTDVAYIGTGRAVTLRSVGGGRFALCGARTQSGAALCRVAASQVPVELRGAGQSSRLVRNFGTPGALEAVKIIA